MEDFRRQPDIERRFGAPPRPFLPLPSNQPTLDTTAGDPHLDIPTLVRKYMLLALMLTILGASAGFVAVAFFPPTYKSRVVLEVQPANSAVLRIPALESDGGQIDLQTEAQVLLSSSFLQKVLLIFDSASPPPIPSRSDIFSAIRRRLRVGAYDEVPAIIAKEGLEGKVVPKPLAIAIRTLSVRPVPFTRVLEISCESTNPELGSNFLNSLAEEYVQQNFQSRMQTVQATSQWLSQKLDETKNKMLDADQRLQNFVRSSGNLFVTREQDNTLADSQLREYQERLSAAEADLIQKQTRYEMIQKNRPETLSDVVGDTNIRGYQNKIADLRQQEALLTATLTPENPRVKRIESQIAELEANIKTEADNAAKRIANEYETSRRDRDLLNKAYTAQASRVGAQAGKAAEYGALKRESESAHAMYNTLLLQSNQADIAGSVPVNSIRIIDRAVPPLNPYKPKPAVIIGIGTGIGFGICCALVFIRERLNRAVTSPSQARQLCNLPQLGIIPSVETETKHHYLFPSLRKAANLLGPAGTMSAPAENEDSGRDIPSMQPLVAESFRVTLASLMRDPARRSQVILVTSPGPGEGKTTVTSNLGIALAETGRTVLIIDADFRRPRAHKLFGIQNTRGLSDLLDDRTPVEEYPRGILATPTSFPQLCLLANGRRLENISKALYSGRFRELLERLKKEYDTIVIDAPPLLQVADARIMSALADGTILVLRSGVSNRNNIATALDHLRSDGTVILGTVLNDWKVSKEEMKTYYYSRTDAN